ncbi:phosphatase PAP2 family protein [Candidatus Neomarinimicrobiota bacterium]
MKPVRYHFDRLILLYLGVIFAITFVGSYFSLIYLLAALAHMIMIFMVLRITGTSSRSRPRTWLRWFYPLLLLLPLHYEIELVGTVFYNGAVYDGLVRAWDQWLFKVHPHQYLAEKLPGLLWQEFFHLMYLSYFAIVIGGYWRAWRRGRDTSRQAGLRVSPDLPRYIFVFLGVFVTYMMIFILFPVVGPLDDRFLRFSGHGLLGPFLDLIYTSFDSAGGAFPSSHVGEAIVIYLLLNPRSPAIRALLITVIMGLTISTVYGSFHYGIDAVAGLLTGPLFFLFWSWIYERIGPESAVPIEEPALRPPSEL